MFITYLTNILRLSPRTYNNQNTPNAPYKTSLDAWKDYARFNGIPEIGNYTLDDIKEPVGCSGELPIHMVVPSSGEMYDLTNRDYNNE